MGKTALQLVTSACYLSKLTPPSALISATDSSSLQLLELFYETGRELRNIRWWPQLKKRHEIRLISGRDSYPLPADFYAAIPDTQYDQNNNWQLQGALPDGDWNERLYGYFTIENRKAFRVFGPDINKVSGGGQFKVHPTPGDGEQGVVLSFEYLSKSWLTPPLWVAGGSYSESDYISNYGYVYTAGSTATAGSVPPNMHNGVGRDGGCEWLYLSVSAWSSTTAYAAGSYVTNGGRLYVATVSGTSGSPNGPVGTTADATETDGTVTWKLKSTSAWAAYTSYSEGSIVTASSKYYKNVVAGKSAEVAPTWTATTVSDGTITWTEVTDSYDSLVTDSDLCLFDDELMIAGLTWRFLRSQGYQYQDLLTDYYTRLEAATNRYQPGTRFNLTGDSNREIIYLSNIGTNSDA